MNTSTLKRLTPFSFLKKFAVYFADWAGWLNFVDRRIVDGFKRYASPNTIPQLRAQANAEIEILLARAELLRAEAEALKASAESERIIAKHREQILDRLRENGSDNALWERIIDTLADRLAITDSLQRATDSAVSSTLSPLTPSFLSIPSGYLVSALKKGDLVRVERIERDFIEVKLIGSCTTLTDDLLIDRKAQKFLLQKSFTLSELKSVW